MSLTLTAQDIRTIRMALRNFARMRLHTAHAIRTADVELADQYKAVGQQAVHLADRLDDIEAGVLSPVVLP